MVTSPLAAMEAAPGIRAIACSRVKVFNCSGLSLAGLALGGMERPQKKAAGPYSPAAPVQSWRYASAVTAAEAPSAVETAAKAEAAPKPEAQTDGGLEIGPVIDRRGVIDRRRIIGRGRSIIIFRPVIGVPRLRPRRRGFGIIPRGAGIGLVHA